MTSWGRRRASGAPVALAGGLGYHNLRRASPAERGVDRDLLCLAGGECADQVGPGHRGSVTHLQTDAVVMRDPRALSGPGGAQAPSPKLATAHLSKRYQLDVIRDLSLAV